MSSFSRFSGLQLTAALPFTAQAELPHERIEPSINAELAVHTKLLNQKLNKIADNVYSTVGWLPVSGADKVEEAVRMSRDSIAYIHEQTVRWMNKGLTPDELVQKVKTAAATARLPDERHGAGRQARRQEHSLRRRGSARCRWTWCATASRRSSRRTGSPASIRRRLAMSNQPWASTSPISASNERWRSVTQCCSCARAFPQAPGQALHGESAEWRGQPA